MDFHGFHSFHGFPWFFTFRWLWKVFLNRIQTILDPMSAIRSQDWNVPGRFGSNDDFWAVWCPQVLRFEVPKNVANMGKSQNHQNTAFWWKSWVFGKISFFWNMCWQCVVWMWKPLATWHFAVAFEVFTWSHALTALKYADWGWLWRDQSWLWRKQDSWDLAAKTPPPTCENLGFGTQVVLAISEVVTQ